jgi:hypothetical protein
MNVFYNKNSLKYLSRLEKDIRTNIITSIDKLPGEGDVKKMHGQVRILAKLATDSGLNRPPVGAKRRGDLTVLS